jgi:hypothetical protein
MTSPLSPDAFAFFPGWVPPFIIFRIYVENLEEIVQNPQKSKNAADIVPQLCVIGLIAYFEAFCKAHFASLITFARAPLETSFNDALMSA